MTRAVFAGIGSYVPPKVVKNEDLAQLMTTSDEWIRTRTGIEERHFAEAGVSCSDLAFEASRRALEDAGIEAKDLDFIILNTTAASIPLLLDETYRAGRLQRGDLPLLLAFGSDFTWGSALVRW